MMLVVEVCMDVRLHVVFRTLWRYVIFFYGGPSKTSQDEQEWVDRAHHELTVVDTYPWQAPL